MTNSSRTGRFARYAIAAVLVLLGLWSGAFSLDRMAIATSMPAFLDPARAEQLLQEMVHVALDDSARTGWEEEFYALKTNKWTILENGEGWMALSVSLFVAGVAAVASTAIGRDIFSTPHSVWLVRLPLTVAILAQFPYFAWYYRRMVADQHCCAMWADSAGIPVFSTWIFLLGLLVLSMIYFLPLVRGSRMPATLLGLPAHERRGRAVLWGLYLTLPGLVFGFLVLAGLHSMASVVPLGLVGLWTTLVALASALNPAVKSSTVQTEEPVGNE